LLLQRHIIGELPELGDLAVGDAKDVDPGKPHRNRPGFRLRRTG
jgi:hypothetical protein